MHCHPRSLFSFTKKHTQDALEAYDHGLAGVVLSNHGGRQLDFARSGIEVLVEVVTMLKEKRGLTFPNDKFSLFVDGGVRRATDVLKAVALGATAGESEIPSKAAVIARTDIAVIAVGVGRPFLYAFSAYGTDGVDKALQILKVSRPFISAWVYSILIISWTLRMSWR